MMSIMTSLRRRPSLRNAGLETSTGTNSMVGRALIPSCDASSGSSSVSYAISETMKREDLK